jgi:DNA-binding beta-propeller fold protein YncE
LAIGNDTVYVADEPNHLIQAFTLKGKFIRQWGGKGTGAGKFGDSLDVAADNKGNVYVTDGANNLIQKFNAGGKF